ncbi:MAG: hypothetical protein F4X66_20495 [Chloroflexi bacterium]|nr:hypothetical protein [Chloroflexota bacterium]
MVAIIEREAANTGSGIEEVASFEDAVHEQITRMILDSQESLGSKAVQMLAESVKLKRIVRDTTIAHSEGWPQDSWDYIVDKFADIELCLMGALYHIDAGVGKTENVRVLARWSLDHALDAYNEAGDIGPYEASLRGIIDHDLG